MGLFGKLRKKVGKNKSKNKGANAPDALQDPLQADQTSDPLAVQGLTDQMAAGGRKAKHAKRSSWAALLAAVRQFEGAAAGMDHRDRTSGAKQLITRIEDWQSADGHAGQDGRQSAANAAVGRLQSLLVASNDEFAGVSDSVAGYRAAKATGTDPGDSLDDAYFGAASRGIAHSKAIDDLKVQKDALWKNGEKDASKAAGSQMNEVNRQQEATMGIGRGLHDEWMQSKMGPEQKGGHLGEAIGTGAINTVYHADVNGKKGVFKEDEAQDAADVGGLMGIQLNNPMLSNRTVASSRVGEVLGSKVMGSAEFAEADGKLGTLSSYAAGEATQSAASLSESGVNLDDLDDDALKFINPKNTDEFLMGGDFDYSDPVLQKELIELQINDSISMQADRHAGNYHIERDESGAVVGVNAFDNDVAFGLMESAQEAADSSYSSFGKVKRNMANTVGLPPVLDMEQYNRILGTDPDSVYAAVAETLPPEEAAAARARTVEMREHAEWLYGEGRVFENFNEITYELLTFAGKDSSYVAREADYQRRSRAMAKKLGIK